MNFGKLLEQLSVSDLTKAKDILDKHLKVVLLDQKREAKNKVIKDYVSFHDNFVDRDDVLFADIQADLESLDIKRPSSGTSTLWLSPDDQSYTWNTKNGNVVNNKPVSFCRAPGIRKLLTKINEELGADLNSCLVTLFKNGRSSIRLHQDDEPEMDHNAPICVFTVGEGRQVDFLSKYQAATETPVLSLKPKEGALYVMKSGCQEWFKHRVPASNVNIGFRFSLSFRKKIPVTSDLIIQPSMISKCKIDNEKICSPVKLLIEKFDKVNSDDLTGLLAVDSTSPPITEPQPVRQRVSMADTELPKRKSTTVLFGTSITASLAADRINVKRDRKFVNISKRGAKIPDIDKLLDNFYLVNPSANDVDKIVFSFGTNDIKYETKGVKQFKEPIVKLIKKAKFYFPDAIILMQCTLPMRNTYWYTCSNFLGFNDILREVCCNYNCVFIDCFSDFLSRDKFDHNSRLYNDPFHLNFWGRNILCKWLSKVCNSNSFNRVVESWI